MIETKVQTVTSVHISCDNCRRRLNNPDTRSCCTDDGEFFSVEHALREAKDEDWQVDGNVVTCDTCLAKAKCAEAGEHDWSPWKEWPNPYSTYMEFRSGRGRHCRRECGEYERIEDPPKPTLTLVGSSD